ncbi:hypothetical protein [uncultured Ruegeria sp.]|uniref:hypothetical protein n=1 Tax=uncultured Ruegeria sp. TaxID=259304 RepID=UPI00260C3823|nr:hypothetical protein [uncultured Ruegeria sp.]
MGNVWQLTLILFSTEQPSAYFGRMSVFLISFQSSENLKDGMLFAVFFWVKCGVYTFKAT